MLKMLEKQRGAERAEDISAGGDTRDIPAGGLSIGVYGLGPRCGTTHIAIALANCLADCKGYKVCLTEKSDRDDISKLPELKRGRRENEEGPAVLGGVTYLTSGYAYNAQQINGRGFDAVIYDLGSNIKKAEKTLARCGIVIAVAGAAPWRACETEAFKGALPEGETAGKSLLFLNPANEGMLKNIRPKGVAVLPFPFEPDPLRPGKETLKILERAIM